MAEITKADELRLVQARKASPYIRTPQEDGVDYPIPELEGASRKILVDRDTMHSTMCTWGYSRFEPKTALHKKHLVVIGDPHHLPQQSLGVDGDFVEHLGSVTHLHHGHS